MDVEPTVKPKPLPKSKVHNVQWVWWRWPWAWYHSLNTISTHKATWQRTQQIPALRLGVVVPADVGCCWQWCANGSNNFAISRPSWTRRLTIFARISATGISSVSLLSLSFSMASVLVFFMPFLGGVIISRSISSRSTSCSAIIMISLLWYKIPHVHIAYYDAQLCISTETICNARAWPQQCWMSCANGCNIVVLRFSDHGTKEMLDQNFDQSQTWRNNTKQHATGCTNGRNM